MVSPSGWEEPGQTPQFEEITVVLRGMLRVEHAGGVLDVRAGQAVVSAPGEWVRYSSPEPDGAEYVAICLPAFSPRYRASRRVEGVRPVSDPSPIATPKTPSSGSSKHVRIDPARKRWKQ